MKAYYFQGVFRFLLLLVMLVTQLELLAQDVILESQADVDLFDPSTTVINGDLQIGINWQYTTITHLSTLSNITTITGDLNFYYNNSLTNIDELSNLSSLGGNLNIIASFSLTNLSGLNNLNSIPGNLIFESNTALPNLDGLNNLSSIGGNLEIIENFSLTNVEGLNNLISVSGDMKVINNAYISNLVGLENLTSIDGEFSINENQRLISVDGLESLNSIGKALLISENKDLLNINGLSDLSFVGGYVRINENQSLENVDGLISLLTIVNILWIDSNDSLTNIDGLSNLTSIGGNLQIVSNQSLINIDGLNSLSSIFGNLTLNENSSLTNIDGLSSLSSNVGHLTIRDNDNLINLDGLTNLTSIDGQLRINNNNSLTNLDGLSNFTSIGNFLKISDNENLSDCCGILGLLENWVGNSDISNNPSECSSKEEILDNHCEMKLLIGTSPPCIGVENGSIQIYVDGYNTIPFYYEWMRQEDGLTGSGVSESDEFSVDMLGEGTYNITVTNTEPDTAIKLDIILSQKDGYIFEIIKVETTNSSNGQNNGSITLTTAGGIGPYTYSWSGVSSGSESGILTEFYTIPFLNYGEYIVSVEDDAGSIKVVNISLLDEEVEVIPCEEPLDIVILNDVSGSVDATEYNESKRFFVDFLQEVNIGPGEEESRAAIVEWSSENEQELKIPIIGDMTVLSTYLDYSRTFDGGTSPHKAMKYGGYYLDVNARPNVEKVMILSTDGSNGQISSSLVALADEYKAKGYHIISIAFDDAFSENTTRELLRRVASVDALAPGAPSYSQLDADLAKNIVSNYLCPIDPGSSATAYFNRDGAIDIIAVNPIGNCPYPEFVEVTINISAFRELSIPAGTPITFYHNNPNNSGSTQILTWEIPCVIEVDSTETYTISLPIDGASNIFAALNDDGLQGQPISFPITEIEELAYSNNIDNERICLDDEAAIQVIKYSSLPIPSCDTIVNYTINVCNISEVDAFGVTLTDVAPDGFVLTESIFNDNGCATINNFAYDIPADCCFSLFLTYNAAAAEFGYYGNQDVILDGPSNQLYFDFDGSTTTDEDVTIDGSIDCPSTIIEFTKSVNIDESCDDGFVEFAFTINNEMNIPLQGLIFTDILPDPCTWAYLPYGENGLSIGVMSVVNNEAIFTIDEVEANTVATFYMDASLNFWQNDGTLSNTATLDNVPDLINGGLRTLTSNTTNTQIIASPNITLPDTIIVNTANETVDLEAIISTIANVIWTTSGDGQFVDVTSENTKYIFGSQDTLDGEVILFISAESDCNETGASVLIQFVDCSLEVEIIEIGECDNMGTPLDGSDDTYEVTYIVTGDNVGQDSMFVVSLDTYSDTLPYFTEHTLTLSVDGIEDMLSFVDLDYMLCSTEIEVNQEICTEECSLFVDNLAISDCDDNGTPQNSTDDIYQIEFMVLASNPSKDSTFTMEYNGQIIGPNNYGDASSLTLSADSVLDSIWIADTNIDTCGVWLVVNQENCYSDLTCLMSIDELMISDCDDNGTPQDSTDDIYTVEFIVESDTAYLIIQEGNTFGPFENNIQASITLSANNVANTLIFTSVDDENCFIKEVVNQNSCASEITVIDSSEIFIPNIFSPNGDKINDEWFITLLGENIKLLECSVFDRWGSTVFYSSDTNPIWNGKYKQKSVVEGVYIYVITYIDDNGLKQKIVGDVTVIY